MAPSASGRGTLASLSRRHVLREAPGSSGSSVFSSLSLLLRACKKRKNARIAHTTLFPSARRARAAFHGVCALLVKVRELRSLWFYSFYYFFFFGEGCVREWGEWFLFLARKRSGERYCRVCDGLHNLAFSARESTLRLCVLYYIRADTTFSSFCEFVVCPKKV